MAMTCDYITKKQLAVSNEMIQRMVSFQMKLSPESTEWQIVGLLVELAREFRYSQYLAVELVTEIADNLRQMIASLADARSVLSGNGVAAFLDRLSNTLEQAIW